MKEYLASILTVLLVSGLSVLLMPEGEGKRGVRMALSLVILMTLIAPLRTGEIENLFPAYESGAFSEEAAAGEKWLAAREREAVEEGIAQYLADKYKVSADKIAVDVLLAIDGSGEGRTVRVEALKLHLYGSACTANVPAMVASIKEELDVECEVIYHRA